MRIKYQPTVPNSLNSSLESLNANFSNAHSALVEALAYSGLGITDEMTFAEISAILAEAYPPKIDINLIFDCSWNSSGCTFNNNGTTITMSGSRTTGYAVCEKEIYIPNTEHFLTLTASYSRTSQSDYISVQVREIDSSTWNTVLTGKVGGGSALDSTVSLQDYTNKQIKLRIVAELAGSSAYTMSVSKLSIHY